MGFSRQENEWVAMTFSRGSSWPRDRTYILHLLHWQMGSLPLAPPRKQFMTDYQLSNTQLVEYLQEIRSLWALRIQEIFIVWQDLSRDWKMEYDLERKEEGIWKTLWSRPQDKEGWCSERHRQIDLCGHGQKERLRPDSVLLYITWWWGQWGLRGRCLLKMLEQRNAATIQFSHLPTWIW